MIRQVTNFPIKKQKTPFQDLEQGLFNRANPCSIGREALIFAFCVLALGMMS